MAYNIVMPQLSDSMEEGKLIAWRKKPGDTIEKGDVIAEVESDKAIMEVQSFQSGILQELLYKEGEILPVGEVMARIATQNDSQNPPSSPQSEKKTKTKQSLKEAASNPKKPHTPHKQPKEAAPSSSKPQRQSIEPLPETELSPKAKAKAARLGVDLASLQAQGLLGHTLHEKELNQSLLEHYFTKKAQKLLDDYALDIETFSLTHKIDSDEILAYIQTHDIPKTETVSPMQKAIITHVTQSAQKPVYHIYDSLDASLINRHKHYSVTVWLIVLLAQTMMRHPSFRSTFSPKGIQTWPHAHIAVAVAKEKELFMPVIHQAQTLKASEIDAALQKRVQSIKDGTLQAQAMHNSNFALSNLGMFGIERFDAMINHNDSGIAAAGAIKEHKLALTLTLDHRLINGSEAALFMQDLKKAALNPNYFKD